MHPLRRQEDAIWSFKRQKVCGLHEEIHVFLQREISTKFYFMP